MHQIYLSSQALSAAAGVFMLTPADPAAAVTAHLAGEAVPAVMLFRRIWILFGDVYFSGKPGNLFKSQRHTPST